MKLLRLPLVLETTTQLGWPASSVVPLAIILLVATLLYLLPKTSIFGAVLLTPYLGGAVATHARIGSPLLSHSLFGVYIGIIMWGGIYLRSPELRSIFSASLMWTFGPLNPSNEASATAFDTGGTGTAHSKGRETVAKLTLFATGRGRISARAWQL